MCEARAVAKSAAIRARATRVFPSPIESANKPPSDKDGISAWMLSVTILRYRMELDTTKALIRCGPRGR